MAVYLIVWNLNKEGPNYNSISTALMNRLDAFEMRKEPGFESACLITSDATPEELFSRLSSMLLDENDRLIVTQLRSGEYWSLFSKETHDWIAARL